MAPRAMSKDSLANRGDEAISEDEGMDLLLAKLTPEDTSEASIDDADSPTLEAEPETAEPKDTETEAFLDDDLTFDEDDEPEPEPSPVEPADIEVMLGDERVTLTADEIQRGYLRQSDYSRKTADLARDRETAAQERQAFEAKSATLADTLDRLARYDTTGLPPKPTAQMREDDLATYLTMKDIYEEAQKDVGRAQQEAQQQQNETVQQWQRANATKLLDAVPAWKDATRLNADLVAIREDGIKRGSYDEAYFNQNYTLWPHWALENAQDARLYRRAKARQNGKANGDAAPDKRVVKTAKTVRSQASQPAESRSTSRERDARKRFRNHPSGAGSDDRAIEFLQARIDAQGKSPRRA